MPCAELADNIVQCGRSTLEMAISFVNAHDKLKAKVIYGDTDSLFVLLLKGRTVKESFRIGNEIASAITAMNPSPVTLKMEKVYHPCFLLTKKCYVGYSYESPEQSEPVFDAKGIETVRRDTCGAVSKTLENSLRLFFEHQNTSELKAYLQRQWTRILSGRVSLQDFVFAKEVRLGTYCTKSSSSLPPTSIVATKAMRADPRAEPRYAERIPYVVIHGEPGARLIDMPQGLWFFLIAHHFPLYHSFSSLSLSLSNGTNPFSSSSSDPPPPPKRSSLSARLSFVFDQIDTIEKQQQSQKDQTLQRIALGANPETPKLTTHLIPNRS
ncbi:hypothetical protein SO802_013506 [Lithocarpus litseifolius]|uniref:DNA-directed DNA polymerase n=1 Tax=Lithocarpus litseifolius TaxID=425828 RepID=A0AAW2D9G9_9ROSI